jgi:hypothetical protein
MKMSKIHEFIELVKKSISEDDFVKLTFSKPLDSEEAKNVFGRLIKIKKGLALSLVYRYKTKDITKNYLVIDEMETELKNLIQSKYSVVTLICSNEEIVFQNNQIRSKKIENTVEKPSIEHDKVKNYIIAENSEFLKLLGVSTTEGKVYKDQYDKFKQINKYVEIIESLLHQSDLLNQDQRINIVDMGSGKGYLTFALYDLLKSKNEIDYSITGVELRGELVTICNRTADALGWENLLFESKNILDYKGSELDVLIALHACDVATDIAIAQGIMNNSKLIVLSPCCHKQIRKEMHPSTPWSDVLKHGILMERQAEILTDSIRSLIMEKYGYTTKVFEFISTFHTPKNLMITGIKNPKPKTKKEMDLIDEEIDYLKNTFGIKEHYLEKLLRG